MPGPAGDGDPKPGPAGATRRAGLVACPPRRVRTPRRLPGPDPAAPGLSQQRSEIEARVGTAANEGWLSVIRHELRMSLQMEMGPSAGPDCNPAAMVTMTRRCPSCRGPGSARRTSGPPAHDAGIAVTERD
jgi:hypothetical protein